MNRWLRMLLLAAMTAVMATQGWAKDDAGDISALSKLEGRIQHLQEMQRSADAVQERDRDGFYYRLDQLILEVLNGTGAALAAAVDSAAELPTVRERIENSTGWLLETSIARLTEIHDRKNRERQTYDEFDRGMQASVARAFVQDLHALILDYVEAVDGLLEVRAKLGMRVEEERAELEKFILRNVERLHGQIRLDAQTITELRRTLSADPSDVDTEAALRAVNQKQVRSLGNLAAWLDAAGDRGPDAASHRALLIQQQGRLGTELLQREVFATIWREQTDRLKRNVVRNGPNLLLRMFTFAAVLLLAWLVAGAVRGLLRAVMNTSYVQLSQLMEDRLQALAFGITFLAGAVVALATMGWSVMPMLAGLGVAGIVVGFALQDSLKSFVAGWMILFYRAYDVGDYVQVAGGEGRVRKMTLNSTRIATPDNTIKLVPNRKIWDDTIVNLTASRARRLDVEIAVSPENDLDEVENSIQGLLEEHPQILNKPKAEVHLARMDSSEMVFMLRPWVRSDQYWVVKRALLKDLKQRFERDRIALA